MKGRVVVLDQLWGAEAAALMIDGRLEDLLLDGTVLQPLVPGAICRGVVDRLVKGQGGVFLRLPGGARGFLREIKGVSEGHPMIVQVSGVAEPGKAVPVTARVVLRGRTALATPGAPGVNVSRRLRDPEQRAALAAAGTAALAAAGAPPSIGLVIRSAAATVGPDDLSEDLAELAALAVAVMSDISGGPELLVDADSPWRAAWTDWADPAPDEVDEGEGAFARHAVLDAIDALGSPVVDLPGGGSAVIEPTRALVAIDVNTGSDSSPAAALKANIALARELPRQLRLRGLGGQIVIDFAPMPKRDRGTLDQVLRAAFRGEAAETALVGWTTMGLYEMSRKRDRVSLSALAAAAGVAG